MDTFSKASHHNPLYCQWKSLRQKCSCPTNKRFHLYGAKGITYPKEWDSFSVFHDWAISNGYTGNETLSRYDETKSYTANNCFWEGKRKHHGMSASRLYITWRSMKLRCTKPSHHSFQDYGGRGITVCKEWDNFIPFMEWALSSGYDESLTIDRIDVNGNYEPSNCRWVDMKTQANNRRSSHLLTFNGKTQSMTQWAKELNLSRNVIFGRWKAGLPIEEVLRKEKHLHRGETKHENLVSYDGQTLNQKQWAEKLGISATTLGRRLKEMSVEEAFSKPKRMTKRRQ